MTMNNYMVMAASFLGFTLVAALGAATWVSQGRRIARPIKILGFVLVLGMLVALIWGFFRALPPGFRWGRPAILVIFAPIAGLTFEGGLWLYASLRSGELQQLIRERADARRLKDTSDDRS